MSIISLLETDADCGKAFLDTRSFKLPPTTAIKRRLGYTTSFDRISMFLSCTFRRDAKGFEPKLQARQRPNDGQA
jgi:hypothetical protein